MAVIIHYRDGRPLVSIASGIMAVPLGYPAFLIDDNILDVRNSSQSVAGFPMSEVDYWEIQ